MTKRIGLSLRKPTRWNLTLECLEDRRLLSGMTWQLGLQLLPVGAGNTPVFAALMQSVLPASGTGLTTVNTTGRGDWQTAGTGLDHGLTSGNLAVPSDGSGHPGATEADPIIVADPAVTSANQAPTEDTSPLAESSSLVATPVQAVIQLKSVIFSLPVGNGESEGNNLPGQEEHPGVVSIKPGPGGKNPDRVLQEELLLLAGWAHHDPFKALDFRSAADLSSAGLVSEGTEHLVWLPGTTAGTGDKDWLGLRASEGKNPASPWVAAWSGEESEPVPVLVGSLGSELAPEFAGAPAEPAAASDRLVALAAEESASLDLALRQFLLEVDNLGQEVGGTLEQAGWAPCLVALAGTGAAAGAVRRRARRRSARLSLAGGGADETLTWVAGLPGPFRSEEA